MMGRGKSFEMHQAGLVSLCSRCRPGAFTTQPSRKALVTRCWLEMRKLSQLTGH